MSASVAGRLTAAFGLTLPCLTSADDHAPSSPVDRLDCRLAALSRVPRLCLGGAPLPPLLPRWLTCWLFWVRPASFHMTTAAGTVLGAAPDAGGSSPKCIQAKDWYTSLQQPAPYMICRAEEPSTGEHIWMIHSTCILLWRTSGWCQVIHHATESNIHTAEWYSILLSSYGCSSTHMDVDEQAHI
jgi:hypothetical protein